MIGDIETRRHRPNVVSATVRAPRKFEMCEQDRANETVLHLQW